MARVHAALRRRHPDLLTLLAPAASPDAGMGAGAGAGSMASSDPRVVARKVAAAARGVRVELLSDVVALPHREWLGQHGICLLRWGLGSRVVLLSPASKTNLMM